MSGIGDSFRMVPNGRRKTAVKNKAPCDQQITAEQLMREATERVGHATTPVQYIADDDEMQDYCVRKRKEFEDQIQRQRQNISAYVKYADWEAKQNNFKQARSIFERALKIDYKNSSLWLKYVEFEMKHKFINHARNLFTRTNDLLPMVNQFWYKHAYMEELLGNYAAARTVYDKWTQQNNTDHDGWLQYIKFEERCHELDRARVVFEHYVSNCASTVSFGRLVKFEEKHGNLDRCRAGFEKALDALQNEVDQHFYIKFAAFEERQRELERTRMIYRIGLERLPKGEVDELYRKYVAFEKQHGNQDGIDEAVVSKRRFHYDELLKANLMNYDVWFDYIRLEESVGDLSRIRDLYERAVSQKPPKREKRYWQRYIYLWINYALCEETIAKDIARARDVYVRTIDVVSQENFSFAKMWQHFADFEVRQLNIDAARKVYNEAISKCKKQKIFQHYAELELRLGNVDRCRKVYEQCTEMLPGLPEGWISYVDLEDKLGELKRARFLCEVAISQDQLHMPELLWKRYIDLNIAHEDFSAARVLYKRLLQKSPHVRVYKAFAYFEAHQCQDVEAAREILKDGLTRFKDSQQNEDRANLLDYWIQLEKELDNLTVMNELIAQKPQKVRRQLLDKIGDRAEEVEHEYIDYIFPEDSSKDENSRILQIAYTWKKRKLDSGVTPVKKKTVVD